VKNKVVRYFVAHAVKANPIQTLECITSCVAFVAHFIVAEYFYIIFIAIYLGVRIQSSGL